LFRQAMKLSPGDPEPAWKLARSLCWLAEKTKDDKKRRLAISSEAVKAAQTAVVLAPDQAAPHFFLGLSWVYYGDTRGIYEVASRWKEVKAEFEKVIELDPGFMGGASYMLLARAYYYVPAFMGGGREHALEYYHKALKYGPRQFGTHIYLAEHYINEGELDKARALLEQVLTGPPMEGQEPEWEEWKGEAIHYMKKIAEKEGKRK
jgi:tetratricopeptide (TPR) repeat protein